MFNHPDNPTGARPRGHIPRLLVVVAVDAEREAIRNAAPDLDVIVAGVGPMSAAAATATAICSAQDRYDLVISAGIAGGFPNRVITGDLVVATRSVAADLGAESRSGFISIDDLGFGPGAIRGDSMLIPGAVQGAILTVSTVTGSQATAAALVRRHPDAVAEAMEGFGVATAAKQAGIAFAEVRAISNLIGDRKRNDWRMPEALATLTAGFAALAKARK